MEPQHGTTVQVHQGIVTAYLIQRICVDLEDRALQHLCRRLHCKAQAIATTVRSGSRSIGLAIGLDKMHMHIDSSKNAAGIV